MSIKLIKEQIADFLTTNDSEVMAIQGDWGIGKTYTWNKVLNECKDRILYSRYSYVSLFGLNSLDGLKYSIFENAIQRGSIGTEPSLETVRDNAIGISEIIGRKTARLAREIPIVKNFTSTIDAVSFMTIKKMIVVIDDLERRGKGLDVKDVLGLVSLLKEHKECKVVMLLNNNTSGMEEFKTYKEKVIDRDVTFNPTPEECAATAFDGGNDYYDELSKYTISLGIRNIRILKKIDKILKMISAHIIDNEKDIMSSLMHSITLFCWSYYAFSNDGDVPSLDFISKIKNIYIKVEKENENEKKWQDILLKYNYLRTDALDDILIDIIRYGYVDVLRLHEGLKSKSEEILQNKLKGSLSHAWDVYNLTFDDNEGKVIDTFYNAVFQGVEHITPNEFNNVIALFRDLDENEKVTEMIDVYIDRKNVALLEHIKTDLKGFGYVTDSEFIQRIDELTLELEEASSLEDVLTFLVGQSGWSDKHMRVLSNSTVDDYYEVFKNTIPTHGHSLIATALKFGNFSNGTDEMNDIARKAKAALDRIGSESRINKIRVARYV